MLVKFYGAQVIITNIYSIKRKIDTGRGEKSHPISQKC
jgi:hypothetical protein